MGTLRRLVWLGLLAVCGLARQRAGDHVSGEYAALCSECYLLAHHVHKLVREQVAGGAHMTRGEWSEVLDAHCENRLLALDETGQHKLCGAVLVKRHGAVVASELVELVADADGDVEDSSIASAKEVAAALCAHDSVTEACPKNFQVHHSPTDAYRGDPSAIQHTFWNAAEGAVEIHVIDASAGRVCAPGEADPGQEDTFDFKILQPGEEKVFPLAKPPPESGAAPDFEETTFRVKPRHGDCADGFDLYVDFTAPFAMYKIETNAAFDVGAKRSNANAPLNVSLVPDLMPYGAGVAPPRRPKYPKAKKAWSHIRDGGGYGDL